jgi:lipid-A-disaccharide synthase
MIIAGEASGDLHGADLARELLALDDSLKLSGIGGALMATAGVNLYRDIKNLAVMGILEVVKRLSSIRSAMVELENQFKTNRPDLLILIDYPGFNLELAKRAKRFNIPVFYYISPKIWAWREGRIKKIRKYIDRMAVILPFEKEYYKTHGMEVEFIGNPLLDQVQVSPEKRDELKNKLAIDNTATVIGMMPGSRKQEIAKLLPLFTRAALKLVERIEKPVFILPLASTLSENDLPVHLISDERLDIRLIKENRYEAMSVCDAAMAASGTLTMELAILQVPMVVCYRVLALTYLLARPFIHVKFASLVNLVAGREVVPELLQQKATPEKICEKLLPLLLDREVSKAMRLDLARVSRQLGKPGGSSRAAGLAMQMMAGRL